MVTLLFTLVVVLGLLAIAIYFWQKPANKSETIGWPPLPEERRGLFSDFRVNQLKPSTENQLSGGGGTVDAESLQEALTAIKAFQEAPDRNSTTRLLHIVALSDNAKNYRRAIELVLMSWRDGTLSDLSAHELLALFNSEYWVLSSRARTSGAGFVLKDTLSSATRELASTNNPI